MEDHDGRIAGSRCLVAGLLAGDDETARALFRASARYFAKGTASARDATSARRLMPEGLEITSGREGC